MSFDLKKIGIKKSEEDNRLCFVIYDLRDNDKNAILCIIPSAILKDETFEQAMNKWIEAVYLFRDKCSDKPQFLEISNDLLAKKRIEAEIEAQKDKVDEIEKNENYEKTINGQKVILNTANNAIDVFTS